MKRTIFIAFCLLGFFASCQQTQQKKTTDPEQASVSTISEVLSVADFNAKIKATPNAQLIDVRTTDEYANGHIEGSLNINMNSDDFNAKVQQLLKKDQPVLVYCQAGRRGSPDGAATMSPMMTHWARAPVANSAMAAPTASVFAWRSIGIIPLAGSKRGPVPEPIPRTESGPIQS